MDSITCMAVLKFRETAARWIRTAQWHQDQKLALLADGAVSLAVPYSHTKEILMEILRYGADVEVLAPAELRELVAAVHRDAASIYYQPRRAPAREAGKRLKSAVAS
jgi:predicted DNA-binding transcriptional regulator YafY